MDLNVEDIRNGLRLGRYMNGTAVSQSPFENYRGNLPFKRLCKAYIGALEHLKQRR